MGADHPLLGKLRKLCLALPETSEVSSWGHPNFKAGKRVFVAYEWLKGSVPTIAFRLDPARVRRLTGEKGFVPTPFGRGQAYRTVALKRMLRTLDEA